MRASMIDRFCENVRAHGLIIPGQKVLAAVSGGADSMCLLKLLLLSADRLEISVCAVHFNHRLRGAEADRDEQFVSDYCKQNNVPFFSAQADVGAYAKENSLGTEEAGRALRYAFLSDTADALGNACIATAHNADDNAETLLLNLTRGAGLHGLCGIPERRDNIVRPMLRFTRSEIEEFNRENNVPFVTDSTNLEDIYTRNIIRHKVIPVLKEINPSFTENTVEEIRLLRNDEDYLSAKAREFLSACDDALSIRALSGLAPALFYRVLCIASGKAFTQAELFEIQKLCRSEKGEASVRLSGITAVKRYDTLTFETEPLAEKNTFPEFLLLPDTEPAEFSFDGKIYEIRAESSKCTDTNVNKRFTYYIFKRSSVCGNIKVRPRKAGDSVRLSENRPSKSLKKLFIEKKIPAHLREEIPVICDDEGILCVFQIGKAFRKEISRGDDGYIIITIREKP